MRRVGAPARWTCRSFARQHRGQPHRQDLPGGQDEHFRDQGQLPAVVAARGDPRSFCDVRPAAG
jgi:hypothetical protein